MADAAKPDDADARADASAPDRGAPPAGDETARYAAAQPDAAARAAAALRWERMQSLFHSAADLPEGSRAAFLDAECGSDAALRDRVLALLAADAHGNPLIEAGLAAAAANVLGGPAGAASLTFGPYRVTGVLGEGGMGVVYRAHRADLKSDAAIKILRDAALSPARRERFAFEQRALAQLNHPSIARLYDADALPDGTPWFAMELVDGVPITDFCAAHRLAIPARLKLFREVCEAVQHAHGNAIIHRDLKPSNILVRPDGRVKLVDFGISKPIEALAGPADATRTGLRLMTPAYAAPEQVRGGALGVHTDVYSLGVVLYELLAGTLPFDLSGRTPSEAATVITEQVPRKPSVAAAAVGEAGGAPAAPRANWNDLDVLCLTAMHRDPARRYRTVEALLRDLDRYLADEPLEARGDSVRYRAGKFVHRHARAVSVAAFAFALLVAVVVFYTLRLTAARNAAQAETARTQRIQQFMTQLFQGGDEEVGPSDTLRVITLLDRGESQARSLSADPALQAELERTLGGIEQGLGRMGRADTLLADALTHTLQLRHPDDADIARSLAALAVLRSDEARNDEAEHFARRALDLAKRELPNDHPVLAEATSTLGRVLENRGAYDAALPVLQDAVRLGSGPKVSQADLAQSLTELANTYFYLGRFAESDSINHRVLAMSRALFGDRHPDVADDLINLGAIQDELGHFGVAEKYYRSALEITRAWFGENHPKTASNLTMLARALIGQDRQEEASGLLTEAIAIQERAYGPLHPAVAGTLNELGNVAMARARYDEAAASFSRVVDIYRHAYPGRHPSIGVALSNLGSVYMRRGDDRRAEGYFRAALEQYDGTVPPGHVNVGISRVKLGRALLHQKRYAEAERETLAGYRILAAQTDPSTSFLRAARTDLVADYDALGRSEDAANFRAQLADTAPAR